MWQQYRGGKTIHSPVHIKTEKPQQALKTPRKTPTKTPITEKRKTTLSPTKTEKAAPEEASETIRKVQLEKLATEQKGIGLDLSDEGISYRLFLGPFQDRETAKAAQRTLSAKGYLSTFILPERFFNDHRQGFRLLVGVFYKKEQAEAFLEKLQKDGLEAQVVMR